MSEGFLYVPSAAIGVERGSVVVGSGSPHATTGIVGGVYVAVRSGGNAVGRGEKHCVSDCYVSTSPR